MILFVTLETDALGTVSRDHYSVSPDAVDRGIYVNALFPESYGDFVKAIRVQIVDEGGGGADYERVWLVQIFGI